MSNRCIVFGCTNEKHQGNFVGDICSPCYKIITEGDTEQPSLNFIHSLAIQNKRLREKLTIAQLGEDFVDPPDTDCPKCKYHDSVVIVEEFEDATLLEFRERSDKSDYEVQPEASPKLPSLEDINKHIDYCIDPCDVAIVQNAIKELGNFP